MAAAVSPRVLGEPSNPLFTAAWGREALLRPLGKGHMSRDYSPCLGLAVGEGGTAYLP